MKKLFLLLLLFTLGCHKDTGSSSEPAQDSQASTPVTNPVTPPPTEPTTPETPVVTQTWTEEFMELINNHRVSIGLTPLIHDEGLAEIVLKHSQDMASGAVAFGHGGFSERCSASRSFLGGGNWCGENVAYGQKTPLAAYTAWMNSAGHKANIEQSRATHTGFAYAKNSSGTYYWTQIFIEL
jgi:uncharacterized protein YkwD